MDPIFILALAGIVIDSLRKEPDNIEKEKEELKDNITNGTGSDPADKSDNSATVSGNETRTTETNNTVGTDS